jgi:predicted transcriptional regulator
VAWPQESEAEVLRELQYAAHLRGKRDMGLEDLAHTLHVLRDYPAIAPPYSAAAEAAAAAKTAAAGQES